MVYVKNRRWALFALLLGAVAVAAFIWPTRYRPIELSPAARYLAARENRFTGAVDVLTPAGWRPLIQVAPKDTTDPLSGYSPDWRKKK